MIQIAAAAGELAAAKAASDAMKADPLEASDIAKRVSKVTTEAAIENNLDVDFKASSSEVDLSTVDACDYSGLTFWKI